jgi:hypothetical protein
MKFTKILINAVRCNCCKTVALSIHVHDFRSCLCGKVSADGGTEYLKRNGEKSYFNDISLVLCEDNKIRQFEDLQELNDSGG